MQVKVGVLLAAASIGTAVAMAVSEPDPAGANDESSDVVAAVVKPASRSGTQSAVPADPKDDFHFDLNSVRRTFPAKSRDNGLFQPKSWYVAPPMPKAAAAPVAPPAPTAPSLPFTFIGRMIDGKDDVLFLYKNGRQYTVWQGDTVDGTYRVDSIGKNQAKLTYLPMNEQQTLAFNSAIPSSSQSVPAFPPSGPQSDNVPDSVAAQQPFTAEEPVAAQPPVTLPQPLGVPPGAADAPPPGAFVAPIPDRTAVAAMPSPPQLSQQQLEQMRQMQQQQLEQLRQVQLQSGNPAP